ncbi:unnamed protein product [marine sediment metagenome]|uniref:Uncharacterized protein n=1 Tax=marine sediment metagenome TaxID=412755 RepID=X0WB75_9ZZZZ
MAMDYKDQMVLRRAGFLPWEVQEYATATAADGTYQSINIRSATWQDAIAGRRRWIESINAQVEKQYTRKATQLDINRLVNRWYSRKVKGGLTDQRNPWDFIKAEYKPDKKISDYQNARNKRSARQRDYLYNKKIKGKPYG